jgi:hypothetical protein
MKTLLKIWKWLDGNKTIICSIIVAVLSQDYIQQFIEPGLHGFLLWLFIALGTGALFHHIQKGYLSTEKGQ